MKAAQYHKERKREDANKVLGYSSSVFSSSRVGIKRTIRKRNQSLPLSSIDNTQSSILPLNQSLTNMKRNERVKESKSTCNPSLIKESTRTCDRLNRIAVSFKDDNGLQASKDRPPAYTKPAKNLLKADFHQKAVGCFKDQQLEPLNSTRFSTKAKPSHPFLLEEKRPQAKFPMNIISMVLFRVREYTKLQLGINHIKATVSTQAILKHKPNSLTKAQFLNKSSTMAKKGALSLRLNSAPKATSKKNSTQLHWTNKVKDPRLNSSTPLLTNWDFLYRLNINESSAWNKSTASIIQAKSMTDRDIIQYYI